MVNELADVKRIGPPLPRMSFPCPVCHFGFIECGFYPGSNVAKSRPCRACNGFGTIWADVPPRPGETK